jgi:Glutamine amidotransferase domain
LGEREVRHR